jgi:hypothetical protein
MGPFSKLRMKDPVDGSAQVVACVPHMPPGTNQMSGTNLKVRCTLTLVVSGPGIEAQQVEHEERLPLMAFPVPGSHLPIVVDRRDPKRFVVNWGEAGSVRDSIRAMAGHPMSEGSRKANPFAALSGVARAADIAGQMGGEDPVDGGHQNDLVAALKAAAVAGDQDEFRRLKAKLGSQGSGNIIDRRPAAGGSAVPTPDPLDRLQKLADLHASGVLNDAEFAAQKAKILGES